MLFKYIKTWVRALTFILRLKFGKMVDYNLCNTTMGDHGESSAEF
jgi:hypothetical protein